MTATLSAALARPVGPWQRERAPLDDVVVSSRVRLARNIEDLPFPPRMHGDDSAALLRRVRDAADGVQAPVGPLHFDALETVAGIDRQVLVEKHLASPLLAREPSAGLLLRDDEQVSVMVHEEDHVRIQALSAGLQVETAWDIASAVDDSLEAALDWAFSDSLGYLCTCPTNLGTAMRASVMLHLPALSWSGRIAPLLSGLQQVGLVARGLYGEGSSAQGDIFQVSNQSSLGPSEADLIARLTNVAREIVSRERSAREALAAGSRAVLEDRVFRAYGVLSNARLLTSAEALKLLSEIRVGTLLQMLPPMPLQRWVELLVCSQPGFVQRSTGEAEAGRRDAARATLLRQRLAAAAAQAAGGGDERVQGSTAAE